MICIYFVYVVTVWVCFVASVLEHTVFGHVLLLALLHAVHDSTTRQLVVYFSISRCHTPFSNGMVTCVTLLRPVFVSSNQ